MNIASLTGPEIASRRPVSSAVAMARLSPSRTLRMRASIASRKPCMTAAGNIFCRRSSTATAHSAIATMTATDNTGSWSAAK